MNKRLIHSLLVVCVYFSAFLSGCASDQGTDEENGNLRQGKFVLYSNSNIRYKSDDLEGYLDGNKFKYSPGKSINFFIDFFNAESGNITRTWKLGTATAQDEISPFDFKENETSADWGMNVARFLSTLNPLVMEKLGEEELGVFNLDICGMVNWDGKNTFVMFDSPLDDDTLCESQNGDDIYTVHLEQATVDESLFGLSEEKFENHTGLINIFAYGDQGDDIIFYNYTNSMVGWDSKHFGLPVSFWKYQRKQLSNFFSVALNAKYEGKYQCEYSGSGFLGELDLEVKTNFFGNLDIFSYYGNSCNDVDVRVYGDIADGGIVLFYISQFWLFFEGNISNGEIVGDFYMDESMDDYLGCFSCKKY